MVTVTFPQVLQRLAPLSGPVAGRAAEMDVLRGAWRDATSGRSQLALLGGEAGVGKTRLAAELAGEVDAAGGAVLFGGCPDGGAEPYHPLVEALGPLPIGDGKGDRESVFETMAAALAARARRTPVLLVLDDLHRADRSTLLALRRLVESTGECPLLVLGTYRDTALDRSHPLSEFLASVLSRDGVLRLSLEGLPPEALVEMVGDAELARRLWRQSEGNPVRVGELLRLGSLDQPLPPTFDDLVARRMEALSAPARALVDAAAVAGSEFSLEVVAEAAGVGSDRLPSALKQLAAARFVVEEPSGPGATRRFVHDMVRDAVVRGLDPAERVRLHLRIGQALDRWGPGGAPPAALLAWHFKAAAPVGGSDAAMGHAARAGDRAMELLAWEEAAVHYGHALAAATGVAPQDRADLLLSLGEAQRQAGETARARQAFLEAATLARACQDGARLARAALALGHVSAVWGADPELEELAVDARALLGQAAAAGPAPLVAPITDFSSDALYDVLDGVGEEPPPAAVVPRADGHAPTAALLRARHVALAGPEHVADRLAAGEDLLALAARTGDRELAATGHGWRVVDALELGLLDQAAADQTAHAELARRLGDPRHAGDAAGWSAMRAMLEGRVEDARTASAVAYARATEAGDPEADESFLVQRWWLALEWGASPDLSDVVNGCRAQASTSASGRRWRAAAALGLARDGRVDLAAEELRRVTDHGLGELIRDPGRLHPLTCLAEVAWILGDAYRAATVGPLLEPFADRMVVAGRGLACRGSVARACGLVAASAHRFEEAERHFETALAVHRRIGALPLLARTRYEWSRVVRQRGRKGDKRRAADSRRKAAELASRLAMTRLLEEMAGPPT